ncbi:MAG: tetratricopeptide repeat protein, partial [Acetobacteraceae bacterium]
MNISLYARRMIVAGEAAIEAGQRVEGINALKFAIGTTSLDSKLLYQLGHAQFVLGCYRDAEVALRQSLAIEPRNAPALNDLAATLFAMDRDTEALSYIAQALAVDPNQPEAAETDSIWLLRYGRFREGWRQYEARLRTDVIKPYLRNFGQPQWFGEALVGRTILLHAEQGVGDTIHFARYAPMVAERGGRVVLEVQPGLRAILGTLPGLGMVLERGEPLPRFDLHCPLPSLPLAFGTELESIPTPIPYVSADPGRVALWRQRLGPRRGMRIGIACSGNPRHRDDAERSIALAR